MHTQARMSMLRIHFCVTLLLLLTPGSYSVLVSVKMLIRIDQMLFSQNANYDLDVNQSQYANKD